VAGATATAESTMMAARREEAALRQDLDHLAESRLRLFDDVRATLDTCHEWLATADPRSGRPGPGERNVSSESVAGCLVAGPTSPRPGGERLLRRPRPRPPASASGAPAAVYGVRHSATARAGRESRSSGARVRAPNADRVQAHAHYSAAPDPARRRPHARGRDRARGRQRCAVRHRREARGLRGDHAASTRAAARPASGLPARTSIATSSGPSSKPPTHDSCAAGANFTGRNAVQTCGFSKHSQLDTQMRKRLEDNDYVEGWGRQRDLGFVTSALCPRFARVGPRNPGPVRAAGG
jgi:hypothetical protein